MKLILKLRSLVVPDITIGYMNTEHGMALLPSPEDWPSRPALLDETTVVDHDLLQMLDPLPDHGDVLSDVGTFTRSIGQGRLFVPSASAHQWASMWLTVQELEQLATMGALASLTVPTRYDLTKEDDAAVKAMKAWWQGLGMSNSAD